MERDESWTTPSDLADYAYCPRSHWYRHHPPERRPSVASQESALHGVRYHGRVLTGERHRAERGAAYWAVLLVGAVLVVGGAWWIFHT